MNKKWENQIIVRSSAPLLRSAAVLLGSLGSINSQLLQTSRNQGPTNPVWDNVLDVASPERDRQDATPLFCKQENTKRDRLSYLLWKKWEEHLLLQGLQKNRLGRSIHPLFTVHLGCWNLLFQKFRRISMQSSQRPHAWCRFASHLCLYSNLYLNLRIWIGIQHSLLPRLADTEHCAI